MSASPTASARRWSMPPTPARARAIDLHFADGRVAATVGDPLAVVAPVSRRVERKAASPYPPQQPNLFDREE